MSILTYLFFDGECAEAFEFYKSVFGGEFQAKMTFAEGPPEMNAKPEDHDRIMHLTLPVGDGLLMGSDTPSGEGPKKGPREEFSLFFKAGSNDEADKVFAALQQGGGAMIMPMAQTFWGSYFGMCRDQFGVAWMVAHDTE